MYCTIFKKFVVPGKSCLFAMTTKGISLVMPSSVRIASISSRAILNRSTSVLSTTNIKPVENQCKFVVLFYTKDFKRKIIDLKKRKICKRKCWCLIIYDLIIRIGEINVLKFLGVTRWPSISLLDKIKAKYFSSTYIVMLMTLLYPLPPVTRRKIYV